MEDENLWKRQLMIKKRERLKFLMGRLWMRIMNLMEDFRACISNRVGDGSRIRFWKDKWSWGPLKRNFAEIYRYVVFNPAKKGEYFSRNGNVISWHPICGEL